MMKITKKSITTFLFLLFIQNLVFASDCGQFQVRGIVKEIGGNFVVVVNEGTKSEIILTTPTERAPKFLAYNNRPMIADIEIATSMKFQKGIISKLINIDFRVPNPSVSALNTGLDLVKKMECK